MNRVVKFHRLMVLWIVVWTVVYEFEVISNLAYLGLILPQILIYTWFTSRNLDNNLGEKEQSDEREVRQIGVLESADQIIIDDEFEENISLECGGYVRLEGWREQVVDPDDVTVIDPEYEYEKHYDPIRINE
jgi:hypothetical protein